MKNITCPECGNPVKISKAKYCSWTCYEYSLIDNPVTWAEDEDLKRVHKKVYQHAFNAMGDPTKALDRANKVVAECRRDRQAASGIPDGPDELDILLVNAILAMDTEDSMDEPSLTEDERATIVTLQTCEPDTDDSCVVNLWRDMFFYYLRKNGNAIESMLRASQDLEALYEEELEIDYES